MRERALNLYKIQLKNGAIKKRDLTKQVAKLCGFKLI